MKDFLTELENLKEYALLENGKIEKLHFSNGTPRRIELEDDELYLYYDEWTKDERGHDIQHYMRVRILLQSNDIVYLKIKKEKEGI